MVLLARAAVALPFVGCDKRKQKHAFASEVRKCKELSPKFCRNFSSLPFLLTLVLWLSLSLSIIFTFLLSAFRQVFSHITALSIALSSVTATLCYLHAVNFPHCFPLQFTLYSHPESLFDISFGFYGVREMNSLCLRYANPPPSAREARILPAISSGRQLGSLSEGAIQSELAPHNYSLFNIHYSLFIKQAICLRIKNGG